MKHFARRTYRESPDWKTLDWVCYWVLNPALLFTSAAQKPIGINTVVANGGWIWALMISGLILGSLVRRFQPISSVEFASRWQTAWRFNSVVGLAATSLISPDAVQIMAIFIGASVPLANLMAVSALAISSGQKQPGWIWRCMKSVLLNPFFLSSGGGLVFSLTAASQAWVIDSLTFRVIFEILQLLAVAAIPLSLIAVGTAVIWKDLGRFDRVSLYLHVVKLVGLPILACGASLIFDIPSPTAIALIVFSALPTSTSSHVLGAAYGAAREPTALIVSQSTVFACLTLPLWMAIAINL